MADLEKTTPVAGSKTGEEGPRLPAAGSSKTTARSPCAHRRAVDQPCNEHALCRVAFAPRGRPSGLHWITYWSSNVIQVPRVVWMPFIGKLASCRFVEVAWCGLASYMPNPLSMLFLLVGPYTGTGAAASPAFMPSVYSIHLSRVPAPAVLVC